MTITRLRTAVPVPGGHAPATVHVPAGTGLATVVLGPGLAGVASPRAFADAGLLTIELHAGHAQARSWWQAVADFARRQAEADRARLVLAAAGADVHTVRDLAPTLDPAVLVLAPSWRPRPVATAVRRLRTIIEPDVHGVRADELTCPVVVPRDRPVPRWLVGVALHRVHGERIPAVVADLSAGRRSATPAP